jgi:uncharacterized protein (UPF0333 family)
MDILLIVVVLLSVIGNYFMIRNESEKIRVEAAKVNGAAEQASALIQETAERVSKQLEAKAERVAHDLEENNK